MAAGDRRMSMLDATFLRIETNDTPMHVSMLMTFELPDDAPADFVAQVVAKLREPRPLRRPFNQLLVGSRLAPWLRTVDRVDMEYHVRHSALPSPGGERELGEWVSHLHSYRLDRTRPLWTCHVIEGLQGNRFAVYIKVHHCLTDGVNGIRLATGQLALSAEGEWAAPWHDVPRDRRPRKRGPQGMRSALGVAGGARALARGFRSLKRADADSEPVRLPFQAPPSALNRPVTNSRRVATQQLDLERIRTVAKAGGASLNDLFLELCGDALRRYLLDHAELPEQSLIAGVPVSLREEGQEGGNAVGFVWASLGTDVADPAQRLAGVRASMGAAKAHLKAMAPAVRPTFTLLTMVPPMVVLLSGQGARLRRPAMNVTISNVPGPAEARYLHGARMEACYPISLLFQGLGLNITCITYAGQLNVGVVGGRDALPSLQKIAVHLGEALDTIEAELVR